MSLSRFLPRPRPLRFAGESFFVRPITMDGLAELDDFVVRVAPHPLDALAGVDKAHPDYPAKLREAYLAAESWPPSWDSPQGRDLIFNNVVGCGLFLSLVLDDVSPDEGEELAVTASAAEWDSVCRVAFGDETGSVLSEISRLVDEHIGLESFAPALTEADAADPDNRPPWSELAAGLCHRLGMTPAEFGELTFGQVVQLQTGGKTPKFYDPLPEDPALEDAVMSARREFWRDYHDAEMVQHAEHDAEVAAMVAQYYTERPNLPKPPWIWPGEPPEGFARPNSQPPLEE